MDKVPVKTSNLLANTRAQILSKHLFAVGYVAYRLLDVYHINNERLQQSTFIAGVLHDLGKIDPEFQSWVNKKLGKIPEDFVPEDGVHIDAPVKFSFEKHPRHHELSWVLGEGMLEGCSLNSAQRVQIAHGIYWHHTKPFRKNDKFKDAEAIYAIFNNSLFKEKFSDVFNKAHTVLKDIEFLAEKFKLQNLLPNFCKSFEVTTKNLPLYKKYDNVIDDIYPTEMKMRD